MTLVVDCGNSRLKWAWIEDGRLADRRSESLVDDETAAIDALAGAIGPGLSRALVACVAAPRIGERILERIRERSGVAAELVVPRANGFGIESGYRDPERLGVDRWLQMIACRRQAPGAFVVAGVGTALTIDAVDADGRHLGGLILPGERLMLDAIAANTGRIGTVAPASARPEGLALLGRSTNEAVGHGSPLALAAAVDRIVRLVANAHEATPRLVLTGGGAADLAAWLETRGEIRADLALEGLLILATGSG